MCVVARSMTEPAEYVGRQDEECDGDDPQESPLGALVGAPVGQFGVQVAQDQDGGDQLDD